MLLRSWHKLTFCFLFASHAELILRQLRLLNTFETSQSWHLRLVHWVSYLGLGVCELQSSSLRNCFSFKACQFHKNRRLGRETNQLCQIFFFMFGLILDKLTHILSDKFVWLKLQAYARIVFCNEAPTQLQPWHLCLRRAGLGIRTKSKASCNIQHSLILLAWFACDLQCNLMA